MSATAPFTSCEPAAARPHGRIHFALAVGIILVAAVGWNGAMHWLKWAMAKEPVPPPAAVETDEQSLTSFPKQLPPPARRAPGDDARFILADDGSISRAPKGTMRLKDEELSELGITDHELNWYYMAYFRDERAATGHGPRLIQMDITYYTGLLDAVPHVPTVCLYAGGGRIINEDSGLIDVTIPGAPAPWDKIQVYRTAYVITRNDRTVRSAQYHFFSMNGIPTASRLAVRRHLTKPWVKYCYFAKVQFAIEPPEPDLAAGDAVCREFLQAALPTILQYLPSAQDVEALAQSGGSASVGARE